MQHTHHIAIQAGTITQLTSGGFELSGPVSITKDGSPAPLTASTLTVDITGGKSVEFSNITIQFMQSGDYVELPAISGTAQALHR